MRTPVNRCLGYGCEQQNTWWEAWPTDHLIERCSLWTGVCSLLAWWSKNGRWAAARNTVGCEGASSHQESFAFLRWERMFWTTRILIVACVHCVDCMCRQWFCCVSWCRPSCRFITGVKVHGLLSSHVAFCVMWLFSMWRGLWTVWHICGAIGRMTGVLIPGRMWASLSVHVARAITTTTTSFRRITRPASMDGCWTRRRSSSTWCRSSDWPVIVRQCRWKWFEGAWNERVTERRDLAGSELQRACLT